MMRLLLALALLPVAAPLPAEGDYRRALPGWQYEFPRDHGAHPDFRTEWWYYTGNVRAEDGTRFGFKLTFFRNSLAPPGSEAREAPLAAGEVFIAHFAVTNVRERAHVTQERIGRAGFGQGHAAAGTLDVRCGPWHTRLLDDGTIALVGGDGDTRIDLRFAPQKPPAIHGRDGVHQKSAAAGQASHYITFSRMAATGTITWEGRPREVRGDAWMDHEFGSDPLTESQVGWDWFSIQLASGEDLMLYGMREADGSFTPDSSSSLIARDGTVTELPASAYRIEATGKWKSPHSGATYPMGWRIAIPSQDAVLTVSPVLEDQEMVMRRSTGTVYWEGAVDVGGTWRGAPAEGHGYVELVGYDAPFRQLTRTAERLAGEGGPR
jgi:predicted secreted hydrolase